MKPVPKNLRKDKDYVKKSQFIWVLAWFLAIPLVVLIMVGSLGGTARPVRWLAEGGIIVLIAAAVLLAVIFFFVVDRISSSYLNLLMPGGRSIRSRREQLAADFAVIKEDKRQGRFEEALQKINTYLEKDRDYPEAMFLKAQILWEGFNKSVEARRYLAKVRSMVPESEPLHQWALDIHQEIKDKDDREKESNNWD